MRIPLTIDRRAFGTVTSAALFSLQGSLLARADEVPASSNGMPDLSTVPAKISSPVESVREVGAAFHPNRWTTGQDGATSIDLEDRRALWLFGDTVTEPFSSIRELDLTRLLSSTAMLVPAQDAANGIRKFEYLTDASGKVRPILEFARDEDPARYRLWPIHGVTIGSHVYLYYHKIAWDPQVDVFESFQLVGMGLSRAKKDEWKFERLAAPDGSFEWWKGNEPGFGVFVQKSTDGFVYLWGSLMTGMFLARCREQNLERLDRYQYLVERPTVAEPDRTARWSTRFEPAAWLFDNVPNEMSCHYCAPLRAYLAIHTWNRENRIVLRTARQLTGPWSDAETIYSPPKGKPDTYFYAAKAHPELSSDNGRRIYLTYVDSERYHPRLVEMSLPVPERPARN